MDVRADKIEYIFIIKSTPKGRSEPNPYFDNIIILQIHKQIYTLYCFLYKLTKYIILFCYTCYM